MSRGLERGLPPPGAASEMGTVAAIVVAVAEAAAAAVAVRTSLEALERDMRHVLVLAVVADPEESLRELDRFESCDVLRVTSHDDARLLGSRRRSGIPQWWWWFWRHESDLEELKFSLEDTDEARLCCFCWISAIW